MRRKGSANHDRNREIDDVATQDELAKSAHVQSLHAMVLEPAASVTDFMFRSVVAESKRRMARAGFRR